MVKKGVLPFLMCFLEGAHCTTIQDVETVPTKNQCTKVESIQTTPQCEKVQDLQNSQYSCEVLLDDTPLLFQWYPKTFNQLILAEYNHKERLIDWSKTEPQRAIYLAVHGAGLSQERMQMLKDMFQGYPTIHVVDFDTIDLGNNDFTLSICKKDYRISELLRYRYQEKLNQDQVPEDRQKILQKFHKDISMGCWIDLMRIAMLRSIKQITGSSKAIYMDFDFQLGKKGQSIGTIQLPRGIALADGAENGQVFKENGAVAIGDTSQSILHQMVDEVKKRFAWSAQSYNHIRDYLKEGTVYGAMLEVIRNRILCRFSGVDYNLQEEPYDCDLAEKYEEPIKLEEQYYMIQQNGGNIKLIQDPNSWG